MSTPDLPGLDSQVPFAEGNTPGWPTDEQHFPDGGGRLHAGPRADCWLCESADRAPAGVGDGLPDDAVEAAVRYEFEYQPIGALEEQWDYDEWRHRHPDAFAYQMQRMRALLAAALPHLARVGPPPSQVRCYPPGDSPCWGRVLEASDDR